MKTRTIVGILIVALVAVSVGIAAAQYGQSACNGTGFVDADNDGMCDNRGICGCNGSGMNFVDADNDGICDYFGNNGRDTDGDGIPNGQDDDYVPLQNGSGHQGHGQGGHNR